jgi:hypothetical protein
VEAGYALNVRPIIRKEGSKLSKEDKGYKGKINNKGSQMVEAPFAQPKGKSPSVQKGGDLRAKKSAK